MDGISALKILDKPVLERHSPDSIPAMPLVFYSRYKEPYPRMNPSVGVFVDKWSPWMGNSLPVFTLAFCQHYASTVSEPEIELAPHEIAISGQEWQKSVLSFCFLGCSGFRHRVRMRSYIAFLRDHLIALHLTDSAAGPETAAGEFFEVERSITIRS
jgi:hypothetical protein